MSKNIRVMAAKNWGSGDAVTNRFEGDAAESFLAKIEKEGAGGYTIYVDKGQGQGWAPPAGWRNLEACWNESSRASR